MNTLTFALGILCGAVATFIFIFVTVSISTYKETKKKKSVINEDLVMKLFDRYLKETKDDDGGKI